MDFLFFIIGAILAVLLWWYSRETIEQGWTAFLTWRRSRIFAKATPQELQDWLVEYYTAKNQEAYLYRASSLEEPLVVPLLGRPEWDLSGREQDSILYFPDEAIHVDVEVDDSVINRRRTLFDQTLWDAEIFCANRLLDSEDGLCVEVSHAKYFQFLTSCGVVWDEMVLAVSSGKSTPYRDKMASSIELLENFACKAHVIGIHSVVVGRRLDNQYSVVLHRRSRKVAINRGMYSGIPTFVFQPHCGDPHYDRDIQHSFLREYAEELYDKEGFEKGNLDRLHPDPAWWYDEREVKELLARLRNGTAQFHTLGFGFDLSNCDFIICVCLIIDDEEFWENELRVMEMNWEASSGKFRKVFPLYSQEIDNLLAERLIQPGTAYCIDRTRSLLKDEGA